ncbi:MAG: signal recognition particle-docking protein FtsY, partial [Burkholderiales bacterium]
AAAIEAEAAAAAEAAFEADERERRASGATASPAAPAAPAATAAPAAPLAPTASSAPATPASVELVPAPLPDRKPWLARLKQGLSRTSGNLAGLFVGVKVDEALFEELETALITSDTGVETTTWLLAGLRERVRRDRITDAMQVKAALRALLVELLSPLERPIDIDRAEPLVMMITGVNGAGKTTSIGKLARHLRREGKTVLLAAGDTFRAAAREQLAQWGSRNEVEVIAQQGGDPAAVAFDAVSAGIARRTGIVMVDTAGRLPTQTHLMDELRKIRRVTAKAMAGAPHEVLLVLDGNTGQNMLAQVKAFDDAVQLTGLVVTKLDGTAKGGALVALAHTRRDRPIPVYFIGVGEGIDDLQAFSAEEFSAALVG